MANETQKKNRNKKINISAKIPPDVKDKILAISEKEDRSVSQVITRLLASHPEIQKSQGLALQA